MANRSVVIMSHQGLGDLICELPLLWNCNINLGPNDKMTVLVKSPLESEMMRIIPWRLPPMVHQLPYGDIRSKLRLFLHLPKIRAIKADILLAPSLVDRPYNGVWLRLLGIKDCYVSGGGRWVTKIGKCVEVPITGREHKTEMFLAFGLTSGLVAPDHYESCPICLPNSSECAVQLKRRFNWETGKTRLVAICPGSGTAESHKRYPAERFRDLVQLLLDYSHDIRIAVVGSRTEHGLLESIVRGLDCGKADRCGIVSDLTLHECLGLLSRCACAVTNCSGLSHLAALAGVPIVGIYGPTNPGLTGPFCKDLRVVRMGLGCSPCYRMGFIGGCDTPVCMSMIAAEKVFNAVVDCLNGKPCPPVPWCDTTCATKPKI